MLDVRTDKNKKRLFRNLKSLDLLRGNRDRTYDTRNMSPLLYRLGYAPVNVQYYIKVLLICQ